MDVAEAMGDGGTPPAADLSEGGQDGLHPIKRLEALFKRHIGHTTELAGHVTTLAGSASEAARLAAGAKAAATQLFEQFKAYGARTEQRLDAIEKRLDAAEAPIEAETAQAAEQLSKAVDDVKAAIPAEGAATSADPAEPVITAASEAQQG